MSAICTHFDAYFDAWHKELGALCDLLVQSRRASLDVAFQSLLRMSGGKDKDIAEREARMLLFSSAVRLCDDYYLKKPHLRPSRKRLEARALPYPVSDALFALFRLPFARRAALALSHFGFSAEEIAQLLRVSPERAGRLTADPGIPGWQEALDAMRMTEEEALDMSDRIYTRFAERSVGVENAIHDARNAFDRLAPLMALFVLALFALAVWFVKR